MSRDDDAGHVPAYSFIDLLRHYGVQNPPAMAYRDGQDLVQWQNALEAKIVEILGPVPPRVPVEVATRERVAQDGYARSVLDIRVTEHTSLPAYLLVPEGASAASRRAGLVLLSGHTQYGMDSVCGVRGMDGEEERRRAYALHAVRAGFVVLVPAWWGWSGRDGHLDRVGTNRDKCNVIQMAAAMYGVNVIALHIQDGRAAVDALSTRPEVDPDRIACVGNSYGGRTAMWLTIFEPRIRACVASGCMNTFRERSLALSSCGIQYPFGLLQYADVPELFSLIAPRPMQLQAGRHDPLLNEDDREHIAQTVAEAYAKLDSADSFEYVLHNEGHILRWEDARRFLNGLLGR